MTINMCIWCCPVVPDTLSTGHNALLTGQCTMCPVLPDTLSTGHNAPLTGQCTMCPVLPDTLSMEHNVPLTGQCTMCPVVPDTLSMACIVPFTASSSRDLASVMYCLSATTGHGRLSCCHLVSTINSYASATVCPVLPDK